MPTGKPSVKSTYLDNKEKARQLRDSGMSIREVSEALGRPYQTVYYWVRDIKPGSDPEPGSAAAGHNADKHLCKTCRYRGYGGMNGCDYMYLVGHSRGCKAEECNKYVKGQRPQKRQVKLTLNNSRQTEKARCSHERSV